MDSLDERICLAVRAIVLNDRGKVLLLKRAKGLSGAGKWCLPGGKIEFGHTAEESVMREVKEETNMECSNVQFLFYLDGLPTEKDRMHCPTLFFKCLSNGEVLLNDESVDCAWVNKSNYEDFPMAFENDVAIRRYLENFSQSA